MLKQNRDGGYGFSLSKEGPVVTQVTAGSSAERAGVSSGDRLVKVRCVCSTPKKRGPLDGGRNPLENFKMSFSPKGGGEGHSTPLFRCSRSTG